MPNVPPKLLRLGAAPDRAAPHSCPYSWCYSRVCQLLEASIIADQIKDEVILHLNVDFNNADANYNNNVYLLFISYLTFSLRDTVTTTTILCLTPLEKMPEKNE